MQDLHSADPSQETCARSCRFYGSRAATLSSIVKMWSISALKNIYHQVGIEHTDYLSEVWKVIIGSFGKIKISTRMSGPHYVMAKSGIS